MPYSNVILSKSPRNYWRCNTVTGTMTDLGSEGRNATTVGSPTLSEPGALLGDIDTSIKWGAGKHATTVPDFTPPTFTSSMTFEGWVKIDSVIATNVSPYVNPIMMSVWRGVYGSFLLYLVNTGGTYIPTFYQSWVTANGVPGGTLVPTSPNPVNLDTWHHLVGVWDSATKTASIYVDGKLANAVTNASASVQWDTTLALPLYIACFQPGNANSRMPGWLDELAIYNNRALTADEIAHHYALGRKRPLFKQSGNLLPGNRKALIGGVLVG